MLKPIIVMLYFVVLAHTTHAQSSAFTYQGRLNADNRIATVDTDGVALAAIQGLNQKLDETRAENAALQKEFSEIKRLLTELSTKGN